MKKHKILFLIDKVESGGAEIILLRLMAYFQDKGYRCILLPNISIQEKFSNKINGRFNYIDPKLINSNLLFFKFYSLIIYFIKVFRIIRSEKPAFVLSFLERSNIINCGVSILTGHTSVISIRNNISYHYKKRTAVERTFIGFLIKHLYNRAKVIVSLSKVQEKDLIKNHSITPALIRTIYNPYPIREIQKLSNAKIENKHKKLLTENTCITVGRLVEQKGHKYLIRSFKKVVERIPDAQLIIIGEGELKEYLLTEIARLNLVNHIHMMDYQINPYKFIKRSKVFILTSLFEGFCNSLVEALICGRPVVSTNCDFGPSEILAKNGNINEIGLTYSDYGILIPSIDELNSSSSEKLFSDAIIRLLTDANLFNKYKKLAIVRSKYFDDRSIFKQWELLIDRVILEQRS